ncbi:MAG: DUF4124 domain-containing protein [Lysobacter sp.]|nr:DUF4124 domain-containing protein [Lysobacter sp.]
MPARLSFALLALLLPFAAVAAPQAASGGKADDGVTVYRCTDAQGRLSLRDSPCLAGERQEVRSMLRPKDAPPRPVVAAPPREAFVPQATTQVVVLQPPRPLYECVTPDNARYLSDSPEGNPRWVPAWTQGYPVLARVPTYQPGQLDIRVDNGRVSGGYRSGGYGERIVPTYAGLGGGLWIRDACHPLPQAEVCARLRDRRGEIGRRFSIAQPSERAELAREERSINARLSQDCP